MPGISHKVKYVEVCPLWCEGKCSQGPTCQKYHVYIRPSTTEIINKLYELNVSELILSEIKLFDSKSFSLSRCKIMTL